jgi:hypothetical protein
MAHVPGLISPFEKVGGIVYFARMLSKIRLHSKGELPEEYVEYFGKGGNLFDGRCCRFLSIDHPELVVRVSQGGTDEEILEWAFQVGRKPSEEDIEIWNGFMSKRGWNDESSERLQFRIREAGMPEDGSIQTMFQFIDADEGRPIRPR